MAQTESAARLAQAKTCLRPEQLPAEQWKSLCRFLSSLKLQEQGPLIRPLLEALRPLPDAVRTVDLDWIHRQRQGQRVPALHLARALVWSGPRLDDAELQALLAFPDLPGLTHIKLFGQSLSSNAALAIANSRQSATLEALNLTSNQVDGKGLKALVGPTGLPKLKRLFLGRNKIESEDIKWLGRTKLQPSLERIDLRDNPVPPELMAALQQQLRAQGVELSYETKQEKTALPRRKRGRPSKKQPKSPTERS